MKEEMKDINALTPRDAPLAEIVEAVREVICRKQCSAFGRDGRCSSEDGACLLHDSMSALVRDAIDAYQKVSAPQIAAIAAAHRIAEASRRPIFQNRPTIDELEKILQSGDDRPISIKPDGSIYVAETDALVVARALLKMATGGETRGDEPHVLRWASGGGVTEEQRAFVRGCGLYDFGDTILIWVNEGDFWGLMLGRPTKLAQYPQASPPTGEATPSPSLRASDIVERLRTFPVGFLADKPNPETPAILKEAADVIERLRTSSSLGGIEGGVARAEDSAPHPDERCIEGKQALEALRKLDGVLDFHDGPAGIAEMALRLGIEDPSGLEEGFAAAAEALDMEAAGRTYSPAPSPAGALTAEKAAQMENALRHMLGAIDGGTIDSEEISGDYESGIPPHKWHEQWAFYARAALAENVQAPVADIRSALPPSSARERRMEEEIERLRAMLRGKPYRVWVRDLDCKLRRDGTATIFADVFGVEWPTNGMSEATLYLHDAILSSDDRGREKGNTCNSDDGIAVLGSKCTKEFRQ